MAVRTALLLGLFATHATALVAVQEPLNKAGAPFPEVNPQAEGANPPLPAVNPQVEGANPPLPGVNPQAEGVNPPLPDLNSQIEGATPPVARAIDEGSYAGEEAGEKPKKPHRGVAIQDAGPCSFPERLTTKPMFVLAEVIQGKATSNGTIHPGVAPEQCKQLPHPNFRDQLVYMTTCYQAWGFSETVAACWAVEHINHWKKCDWGCNTPGFEKNKQCQQCFRDLRAERHACALTAVGISQPCQDCSIKANTFWEDTCNTPCEKMFDGKKGPSQECLACSDRYYEMMALCT